MNTKQKTPRTADTYRGFRRNDARQLVKSVRRRAGKITFAEAWELAQTKGKRRGQTPETVYRPHYVTGKTYSFSSDRQHARAARQAEGRANG